VLLDEGAPVLPELLIVSEVVVLTIMVMSIVSSILHPSLVNPMKKELLSVIGRSLSFRGRWPVNILLLPSMSTWQPVRVWSGASTGGFVLSVTSCFLKPQSIVVLSQKVSSISKDVIALESAMIKPKNSVVSMKIEMSMTTWKRTESVVTSYSQAAVEVQAFPEQPEGWDSFGGRTGAGFGVDPVGLGLDPVGLAGLDPDGLGLDPDGLGLDPDGLGLDPDGLGLGLRLDPDGLGLDPDGVDWVEGWGWFEDWGGGVGLGTGFCTPVLAGGAWTPPVGATGAPWMKIIMYISTFTRLTSCESVAAAVLSNDMYVELPLIVTFSFLMPFWVACTWGCALASVIHPFCTTTFFVLSR
jgi:hypothetical protein